MQGRLIPLGKPWIKMSVSNLYTVVPPLRKCILGLFKKLIQVLLGKNIWVFWEAEELQESNEMVQLSLQWWNLLGVWIFFCTTWGFFWFRFYRHDRLDKYTYYLCLTLQIAPMNIPTTISEARECNKWDLSKFTIKVIKKAY